VVLELKLEGQLDRTRPSDLVEGIEAAIWTARAETAGRCLCRVAKQRSGQVVRGRAKVRMVEDVEKLAPESKLHFLAEMELSLERDIRLRGPKSAQYIASEVALSGWRPRKSCDIENLPAGILRAKEH
jgi:hypothetical protein